MLIVIVVPLSHQNLRHSINNIIATLQLTPEDATVCVMPLFHVHGLIGCLLSTLYSGGCVALPRRFSARRFWDDFIAFRCSWYTAVPTIHQILLQEPMRSDLPLIRARLRFIRSCSAPLSPKMLEQLEGAYGAPVLQAYAMTEAAHQMTSNGLRSDARCLGSVGRPTGCELKAVDAQGEACPPGVTGELVVRGTNIMSGYRPSSGGDDLARAAFWKDSWLRTGDLGLVDVNGFVHLTGRVKEMINRGGEKISPAEIDRVLLEHPLVAEAVAFAVDDPVYQSEVHAAVVLKGSEPPTPSSEAAILAFCETKLAHFKCPKKLYFLQSMPKTATGKIQRAVVASSIIKSKL